MTKPIKLTPEAIVAREFARATQAARPLSEVIRETRRENTNQNQSFINQISQKKK